MPNDPARSDAAQDEPGPWRPSYPGSQQPIPERYSTAPPGPRSDLIGGLIYGLGAVVLVAIGWLVVAGPLGLTWGLVGAAAVGGWIVGGAVGWGALDRTRPRKTHPLGRLLAIVLALLAWVAGTYLAYLWKLLIAAKPGEPLTQRLAEQDFARWLASEFGPLMAAQLIVFAIVAWWSSR